MGRFNSDMARIIVVEEDQLIRGLLAEWLGGAGHAVAVHDRIDAMSDDAADLMIVDIVRPRQGGCSKLRDLQTARPRTPVIAISGQFAASSTGASTACSLGVRRVIGKPFTREQLLRVVGDVLAAPSRTVDA
jgi:DNA-binding NtrC family response regulator